MIKEHIEKETVWTVEVGDIVTVKRDGRVVRMPSVTDLGLIGLEVGSKVKKTIEAMPEVGAKTLKMVVSWE